MKPKRRPLRADAVRNRERLLEVARQVFATEGLEAPIDELARRAQVGVGTIYRHFPNKEALFTAIVLDTLDRFIDEAQSLHTMKDPTEAFFEVLRQYAMAGAEKRTFLEALSRSGINVMGTHGRKAVKRIRETLEALLSRAQAAGTIRTDVDVDEVLALLQGLGAATNHYEGSNEGRSRIWAVVLDGLRRRP